MKIIQLSDPHILSDTRQTRWNTNPHDNFLHVITELKVTAKPDMLLLTGDLSQDETAQSYQNLASMIDDVEIDTFYIPGNHDDLTVMQQAFRGKKIHHDKLIYLNSWALILLNSVVAGKISGLLSKQELSFLKTCLQETKDYQVIIALHHHPLPMNSPLIDQYILENREDLLAIIAEFPQVKVVLFGHVHQEFVKIINHTTYLACPSTWIQFRPGAIELEFDSQPPGYRWLELNEEDFKTGVCRVS